MRDRLKLIDIYLGRSTLRGFILVLSVLIVLFSFLELLVQLNDVGKGTYRLQDAFLFVAMTIPARFRRDRSHSPIAFSLALRSPGSQSARKRSARRRASLSVISPAMVSRPLLGRAIVW